MNETEHHRRLTELFLAACELPDGKRLSFLEERCANEPELKAGVQAMLEEDSQNPHFLETPALGEIFDVKCVEGAEGREAAVSTIPTRIGGFNVLRILGEGGMGIVYLAEQDNPRRRVALKVIRPGVFSEAVFRRFRQEAHILGRLQHPGIAPVYDAGFADTESGLRPYFAMEYVQGLPLTEYAENRGLGTRDRLMLMQKVCDAVHHAHQKGIIHRDLKPGNILVDESGQPKILDFGVARATDADIQATTMRTDIGQLVGTISYMSPEQIEGDPDALDTRSDVYALGVLCYRLLAGRLPYELSNKMIHEAARVIRDEEPTPISSVNRLFRGDVETIVQKALEKDRERRYQSASDFGADIGRYVRDEPIVARPSSAIYSIRKFARRNRLLAVSALLLFVVLVGAVIGVSIALHEATHQRTLAVAAKEDQVYHRNVAEQRRDEADLARTAEADKRRRAAELMLDALVRTAPDDVGLRVLMWKEIATALQEADQLDTADMFMNAAVELLRDAKGNEHSETLELTAKYANLLYERSAEALRDGRLDRAVSEKLKTRSLAFSREVCETSRRVFGEAHQTTLFYCHDYAAGLPPVEGERLAREILAARQATLGPKNASTLATKSVLANHLWLQGRQTDAISLFEEVFAARREILDPDDPALIRTMHNLADCLYRAKRYNDAVRIKRDAVEATRKQTGDEDPMTLVQMNNLASFLMAAGEFEEAENRFREVYEIRRRVLGPEHGNTLTCQRNLAMALYRQGKLDLAEPIFRDLVDTAKKCLPSNHPDIAWFRVGYGGLLTDLKRYPEAEVLLLSAYRNLAANEDRAETRSSRLNTTEEAIDALYKAWGKSRQADEWRAKLPATQPASNNLLGDSPD